jgi:hypothetical protein
MYIHVTSVIVLNQNKQLKKHIQISNVEEQK